MPNLTVPAKGWPCGEVSLGRPPAGAKNIAHARRSAHTGNLADALILSFLIIDFRKIGHFRAMTRLPP